MKTKSKYSRRKKMIDKVKEQVELLLNKENSGHGMDHSNRVLELSLKFAEKENGNKEIIALIALLHDVDDYKLFGEENAKNLTNAKKIMEAINLDPAIEKKVCNELKCIGYKKALKGIRAKTIEGKIVSDADMCDALGATGILRVYKYGLKINRPFFQKEKFPVESTKDNYRMEETASTVNFIFEILLKYKETMLTESGKEEASKREKIIIDFLYQFFQEEKEEEWTRYLDNYLQKAGK